MNSLQHGKEAITASKIVGLFILLIMFLLFSAPAIHSVVNLFVVEVYAEYTVYEQFTKYALFLVILSSILLYQISREKWAVILSIGYMILAIVMYLSESNMIAEKAQPIFGAICFSVILFCLFKRKSWVTSVVLLLGIGVIFLGVLSDFYVEHEKLRDILPKLAGIFLSTRYEEIYDMIGVGLIGVSALVNFYFAIDNKHITDYKLRAAIPILCVSALITIGNGMAHYQYRPSQLLESIAFIATFIGFIGFIHFNNKNKQTVWHLKMNSETGLYGFLATIFIILPVVFGNGMHGIISLVFWGVVLGSYSLYLFTQHNKMVVQD